MWKLVSPITFDMREISGPKVYTHSVTQNGRGNRRGPPIINPQDQNHRQFLEKPKFPEYKHYHCDAQPIENRPTLTKNSYPDSCRFVGIRVQELEG